MEYQDILNRIVEIINLSEQKRRELESQGIFDKDKKPEEKNFEVYHPFVIYKEYKKEFQNLKNKELTYCLLSQDEQAGLKNHLLIEECKKRLQTDIENRQDLEMIITILQKSYGRKADGLTYLTGYFIPDEDYNIFKTICSKLNIGPQKKLSDSKEEFLKYLKINQREISNQRKRILKHMKMFAVEREVEEDLVIKDIERETKRQELDDYPSNLSEEKNDINLDGKFKEIIYWGMLGYLDIKMVSELKTILKESEFQELINALMQYGIFTEEELLDIEIESKKKIKTITDIDELVAFFAVRKDLNVVALKALIPSIGIDNYHYLMDQLFRFNTIDFETYKNYLEEFNLLDSDINQSR